MPELEIHVEAHSGAPREAVWDLLADARRWSTWAAFANSELEREGSPTADGVGAIRRFGTGPMGSREEIVAFEPPGRLVYRLLSGMPLRDYEATVTLEPDPRGGTTITWHSTFVPKISGTGGFYRWFLRRFLTDTAKHLARAAETH